MKVDTTKLKKGSSELSPECKNLIDLITKCRTHSEILQFLDTVKIWVYGKCELYHWIEILDRFDKVLEEASLKVNDNEFVLRCDTTFSSEDIRLLLLVLNFTTLLIEHSFSRHLYNSIEHLTQLLSSQNMDIVLAVLNLLYMFSKRSNFIPRLPFEKKETLLIKLFNIAERWGDPNYGLALIDCCMRKPKLEFLYKLFIEYIDENGQAAFLEVPDMMDVCRMSTSSDVVKTICNQMSNPSDTVKMRIAHRVRLVSGFKDLQLRLLFVQARLQAVSILIYSNALQDNIDKVLYPGFGEELCELIDKEDVHLVDIRAAVLRTLTSMLHFDRNPNVPRPGSRLPKIIQYTGAERQGGILPLLVRDCIASLTGNGPSDKYPLILATSLFSLLYHLASYEAGGNALVKSGMMQSLLRVISWPGVDLEHITFVTRAVRVIDLITNIDIAKFHQNNGLNVFIERLENEVNNCREAIADEDTQEDTDLNILVASFNRDESSTEPNDPDEAMSDELEQREEARNQNEIADFSANDVLLERFNAENYFEPNDFGSSEDNINAHSVSSQMSSTEQIESARYPPNSYYARPLNERSAEYVSLLANLQSKKLGCVTQRAALLKSMLNFLKKSIQDHSHFNGMRNIMETSLPISLRHIISNAEYYGPSLFLLATDVVTVYVFNEPSLLSSLQDSGITKIILQSLLQKDVPATREVLGSLPNVFSALCLNERGLMEFMSYEPFDKLLKVLLSPDYLVAMRRRRSSDPLGDTATNLGNAMDDLMKHHPYLRTDATEAIVRLLNELVRLGSDTNFICWRANKESNSSPGRSSNNSNNGNNATNSDNTSQQNMSHSNTVCETVNNENENDSSGEDDEDDDEMSSASQQRQNRPSSTGRQQQNANPQEREAIPLIDYILNVMKFIEAIFSNSSNGEHCREFVLHGGLKPLLQLLSLPNLPVDSPVSTTAQAVANVCKSILNLAHETKVIDTALQQLSQIVRKLNPLIKHFSFPGGSILLRELLFCPKVDDGFSIAEYTPLLHSMSSVHGYVILLVHLCRNASNEMRSILLKRWGTNCENGLQLLQNLVQLYISLVWESTILLSLCSDESQNTDGSFADMSYIPSVEGGEIDGIPERDIEALRKLERSSVTKAKLTPEEQLRYIKSLLAASSRLGRALAELFGTLVKLSVGTPQARQRRNNEYVTGISSSKFPTADAKEIARVLSSILVNGFRHENILPKPAPKLKLTFLICSVGFTGPMLFDDKRSSFHLMISQFCEENGLKAFYDMFFWALALDSPTCKFTFEHCMKMKNILEDSEDDAYDFPEGTGEFLDAWLQLLEKMVNPRAILDSPYAISSRINHVLGNVDFEPVFYLIQMHQLALQTVRRIWKRKPIAIYGVSMTDTIMSILKHLIKSHAMLRERYHGRVSEIKNANKLIEQCKKQQRTTIDKVEINEEHLKILIDMGFIRQHVLDALKNTRSLEQATDYLLNHPIAGSSLSQSRDTSTESNASARTSQVPNNEMDIDLQSAIPTTSCTINTEYSNILNAKINLSEIHLISNIIFEEFCAETLERTFAFMEYLPETINTGAELVSVLYRRHSQSDKHKFVLNLVKNLTEWAENVLHNLRQTCINKSHNLEDVMCGQTSTKLFIRLKVLTLLLDETYADIRKELCFAISQEQSLNSLIMLLKKTEAVMKEQMAIETKLVYPRWLQNLIEFIDAIDSVCVILQRKLNMRAVCNENWKWYDASTGKWNSYSEANNLLLKNAFNLGERSVVINIGRQRYTVNFNCMTQVSEASGSHRPVLPALKITDAIATINNSNSNSKVDNILTRTILSKNAGNDTLYKDEVLCLHSLTNFSDNSGEEISADDKDKKNITQNVNIIIPSSISSEVSEVTSELDNMGTENNAKVKISGVPQTTAKALSNIPPKRVQKIVLHNELVGLSKFNANEIISCLVRLLHPTLLINFETKLSILKLCARLTKNYENAKEFQKQGGITLLLNMQQSCGLMGFPTYAIVIIRHVLEAPSVLQESIERILTTRTSQSIPVGHRDLIFVLTQVSSAVARHPSIFLKAAKQTLRADYLTSPTFSIDDSRLLVKSQLPNRKCMSSFPNSITKEEEEDLISVQISVEVIKELLKSIVQPCVHFGGISFNDGYENDFAEKVPERSSVQTDNFSKSTTFKKGAEKFEPCCCSWHIPSSGHIHQKPVLPRSTQLKILADAVRSYQSLVPGIIIDHVYTPSDSIFIEKEQSCLSFILDNFLPIVRPQQDSEVSMMSRVLISSLSDCYGQPSIQSKLADEIHEAIVRILMQPDSAEKQTRLQVLISLFPIMIESPMLSNKIHVQRNNMYRILLRQGIMTDLSKIAQYKDLSKSNTLATIFSILRPMEILLRLNVAPGTLSSKRIFFGTTPPGNISIANRRFYPRLTSRSNGNAASSSISGEHVLRDIIRNVLSDRRHAFDFIFNADDMFIDSEDAALTAGISADDEIDNEPEERTTSSSNVRSQLNFDRLWDDLHLLQNESLRLVNRSTNASNNAVRSSEIDVEDHHHRHNNDDEAVNNVGGGGSDGASTSSEPVTAVAENSTSLLGDPSSSESDSDSNVSTENDDRNDDDEDDGNEEGVESRSEADADEETRQFIEVFDHIYEPESSETATDVDADDEASDIGGGSGSVRESTDITEANLSEVRMSSEENRPEPDTFVSSEQAILSEVTTSSLEPVNNIVGPSFNTDMSISAPNILIPTTPSSAWVAPRMAMIGAEGHISYRSSIDLGTTSTSTNERNDNVVATTTPTVHINSTTSNILPILNGGPRREQARRLIFLDQQYCTPMPSFVNPTEEGQIELFNQDALHWWLEEAKHLDLESQTDACLYVAHFLIPFLINELKISHNKKKSDNLITGNNPYTNRRSAIPVLIQQSINVSNSNQNQVTAISNSTTTSTNHLEGNSQPIQEPSQFRIPHSLTSPRSAISTEGFEHNPQNVQLNILGETDGSSEDEHPAISDTNEDIAEDDEEDDFDEDDDLDDEDDELNTTFMEEDELNSTFNIDIDEIQNSQANISHALSVPGEEPIQNAITSGDNVNESNNLNEFETVANIEQVSSNTAIAFNTETQLDPPVASNVLTPASESIPALRPTNFVEMSPEVRAALGDLEVPEGVDPSFLAALPSEMRDEVIQEHLRMQRIRLRAQQNAIQVAHDSLIEVNPEFLAALPPNIQSEVLMQQRIEQQRHAAQSSNPDDPVDTAAFFQNLPESLRQAILTDMEESQISSLPPDLAAEAQYLRRDWESRNGTRLDATQSNTLSGYLTARFPSSLQSINDESRWHTNSIWYDANGAPQSQHHHHTTIVHQQHQQLHGKPIALLLMEDESNLLDPDSLTTLLLFLFIEDPKINLTRLHRVVRNFCYHLPTREWIVDALISIIQKTNEGKVDYSTQKCIKPQWLNLRVDAAFGYKSNVFIINKLNESSGSVSTDYCIRINPQAAQMIIRNCLDLLFVLAKHFPRSFVPFNCEHTNQSKPLETNISRSTNETVNNVPMAMTLTADNTHEIDNDMTSDELRAIINRRHSSHLITNSRRFLYQGRQCENKLDDSPSTSRAAAVRNQHKPSINSVKNKLFKGVQYSTNSKKFWDVLLNIEVQTQNRLTNVKAFPLNSQPTWEWENKTSDFVSFNDSAFAKLLEMLPYKVICRSPQLTDMLVKLLAFLSSELPKEDESIEQEEDITTKSNNEEKLVKSLNESADSEDTVPIGENNLLDDDDKYSSKSIKQKMYLTNFSQMQLVVEVLTHQCGTTDGLDNISKLIVNLSLCSQASNAIFLQYLTAAILGLAQEVRQAIQSLLNEIRNYNATNNSKPTTTSHLCETGVHQGIMQDRFTSENIIISAPMNIKPSCELQLPVMKKLLSSSSAQPYFLRTLKIFMQVRELFQSQENANNSANTLCNQPTLSQIICLDHLWNTLSECLMTLEESKDEYAVLVLQPSVEAFFLIHALHKKHLSRPERRTSRNIDHNNTDEYNSNTFITGRPDDAQTQPKTYESQNDIGDSSLLQKQATESLMNAREEKLKLDREKFLLFAEKHRTVLNQILRQSATHLSDGPFAVLVDHTRILDFDVKRKYFQTELERIDEGVRREENTVSVRRVTVFEDSFRILYRLGPEEWKNRFYIVFEDEEGQDAGGLLREWYVIISREIFNPMYALFCVSPGDRVTYMINPSSHANPNHLSYFKFVGRIIAKAVHDNKLLECYFTRSFYKHILGKQVKYTDMESQDYEFYKGLDYLMKNDISTLGYELTFSTEVQEFGVTQVRDLIPNGRDIAVTEENKFDYVQLVCQLKMSGSIRQQLNAFLEGFYDIIPKHLISIFNEQELELLISGLPDIDIEDLKANTEYHKYTSKSIQIQWFWRALRSFDQADRAKFLQFVTGTSKVPLQGFGSLEGMNGIQKFQIHRDDRSTDRLPCAHTCFNQLDLPMYKSYDKLRSCLLKAIHECSEGFGFA